MNVTQNSGEIYWLCLLRFYFLFALRFTV